MEHFQLIHLAWNQPLMWWILWYLIRVCLYNLILNTFSDSCSLLKLWATLIFTWNYNRITSTIKNGSSQVIPKTQTWGLAPFAASISTILVGCPTVLMFGKLWCRIFFFFNFPKVFLYFFFLEERGKNLFTLLLLFSPVAFAISILWFLQITCN